MNLPVKHTICHDVESCQDWNHPDSGPNSSFSGLLSQAVEQNQGGQSYSAIGESLEMNWMLMYSWWINSYQWKPPSENEGGAHWWYRGFPRGRVAPDLRHSQAISRLHHLDSLMRERALPAGEGEPQNTWTQPWSENDKPWEELTKVLQKFLGFFLQLLQWT